MICLFVGSSIISMVLLLWFKTEVWYEYSKVFRIARQLASEYEAEKQNDMTITYIHFLRKNYQQYFFIRLITCPICTSFWIAFGLGLNSSLIMTAPLMLGGLVGYGIVCKLLDI